LHGGSRCDFLCSPIDPGAADSRRGEVLCPTQSSNGAAIIKRLALGIVACIGDEGETPTLHAFGLNEGKQVSIDLPGRARWRVTDAEAKHVAVTSAT